MVTWRVSLNTWLVQESPIHTFYFWTLSRSLFCRFFGFYGGQTSSLFSQSCQPLAAFSIHLCTWLHKTRTLQRASHAILPFLCRQETSSRYHRVMHVSNILPGCEHKLTFWVWPQIDIPKAILQIDTPKTHTHIHCKNRSLIQSLTLMRPAIMKYILRGLICT